MFNGKSLCPMGVVHCKHRLPEDFHHSEEPLPHGIYGGKPNDKPPPILPYMGVNWFFHGSYGWHLQMFGDFWAAHRDFQGFPSMFSTNIRQKAQGTHQGTGTTGG
jgi:hypothetical protein